MKIIIPIFIELLISPTIYAKDHLIIQKNKKFSQIDIVLNVGDSISFKNDEKDVTHNVYSLGPTNEFELKSQAPGQVSKVEFKTPGIADIECAIHTNMKLKVTVKK